MFPLRLPPVMARLHERLEYYDEYERPQRGFFLTELDGKAERPAEADPVLVYVLPASLVEDKGPERRPPDWIGEVLTSADAPSRLERYARAGVREYWRVRVDPALPDGIRFEVHTEVEPEAGRYARCEVVPADGRVESATFPGLELAPRELFGEGPPVG